MEYALRPRNAPRLTRMLRNAAWAFCLSQLIIFPVYDFIFIRRIQSRRFFLLLQFIHIHNMFP